VAVAAGACGNTVAVGDLQLPAGIALRLIAPQRCRATVNTMPDHLRVPVTQAVAALIRPPVLAEDIGDVPLGLDCRNVN